MAKRRRRLKPKKSFYLLVAVIVLSVLVGVAVKSLRSSFSYVQDYTIIDFENTMTVNLGDLLFCTDTGSYTGLYMEDGTDELVSDVMRMVLNNASDNDLQYAEITLMYGQEKREFVVSNLPSGKSCLLLEKSRQSFPAGDMSSYATANVVFFAEPMKTYEDVFEVSGQDGILNVKNISGKALSGDVAVYYKYCVNDVYYGGITFRVRISGGFDADEIKQIPAVHFDKESSVLTMVTYNE